VRLIAWVLLAGLCAMSAARAANPNGVFGTWWTQDHDGVVQIAPCNTGLCGTVVGITGFQPDGSPPQDLHGHSRCRLRIIPGGTFDVDGIWNARITDPNDDKTYTIQLRLDDDGHLRMRGYIGIPLFGRTVYWTRFEGHLTPDCHVQD
jgi:uncharacterized protein (DUF2147 family)